MPEATESHKRGCCYSDFRKAYRALIPQDQHEAVGKGSGELAQVVERWNTALRQCPARFVRKALSFSKSDEMHEVYLKLFVHRYDAEIIRCRATTPSLPAHLAPYAPGDTFAPNELGEACRTGGEGLGRADAGASRFRSAEMLALWEGLDLPAWIVLYALRDAHLGYLADYGDALVSGKLSEDAVSAAAVGALGR